MLEKLQRKFKNAITDQLPVTDPDRYLWLKNGEGRSIGIPHNDLTADEVQLLELLFDTSVFSAPPPSHFHNQWQRYLLLAGIPLPLTGWKRVRFTYFRLAHGDVSPREFEEAILSFVSRDSIWYWESKTEGVLIEGDSGNTLSKSSLHSASSTLEADFYVKIRLYMGHFHIPGPELRHHYQIEKRCFSLALDHLAEHKVTDLAAVLPHALLEPDMIAERAWFVQEMLGDTLEDTELLRTVKTYIESGSNATLAAKILYIHRNSLQYRIDKFTEKTGLDIKNFHHALTTYLVLLLHDQ